MYYALTVREELAGLAGKDCDPVILNVCFSELDDMELLKNPARAETHAYSDLA